MVACLEEALPFAALQVFEPKLNFAFIVADVGDVFPIGADARLRESAVFPVFQLHHVRGLVGHEGLITVFVELKPFLDQFLVFFSRDVEQGFSDVLGVLGQGQNVVERLAAVCFVDEVPERITCYSCVFIVQVVDFLVVARNDATLQLAFFVTIPIAGDEGHQSVAEPLWHVVAIRAADL